MRNEIIKGYFDAANLVVLASMYLKNYKKSSDITLEDLKDYNPGHLGTSMSLNFILANLNYFLHQERLKSRLVVGMGHAGVSLMANDFLDGTLTSNGMYDKNLEGLNSLISDFGTKIRSEINPEYPEVIYDGGELGYSLCTAYGYALGSNADIIPCVIGDGEAETGTLNASWMLNRMLKTKSKVLPIINLNMLKMGSVSYLARLNNQELQMYFNSLGYQCMIVDGIENSLNRTIDSFQTVLQNSLHFDNPLIIVRTNKGYTLPNVADFSFQDNTKVHKNPLDGMSKEEKLGYIKGLMQKYENYPFLDEDGNLLRMFNMFNHKYPKDEKLVFKGTEYKPDEDKENIAILSDYLKKVLEENRGLVFSPDELYSNKLGDLAPMTFEMLNENVLLGLYQGYVRSENFGIYASYEAFMAVISSMLSQYYKYLVQLDENNKSCPSLNFVLTSTWLENTYSHQNPDIVNTLLEKDDRYYRVMYPKDGANAVRCLQDNVETRNQINMIITSKRHKRKYQSIDNASSTIDVVQDSSSPNLIICATGDYMLDCAMEMANRFKDSNLNIKIVYVTNPKVLDRSSSIALSDEEFARFINPGVPVYYLYAGYPYVIKSLLFGRNVDATVYGYQDRVSHLGGVQDNLSQNNINIDDIIKLIRQKSGD